ncbi:auxilin-related protein 1 isoform X2 [Rosa chinensis]|uniref:auxilin-related protein 1 isoform X1 n=1 Tax=Rosa chinensis TaxID=74649 RepID=UPI000D08FBAD|nr:auxilin-related protein 1 isoform X1 [Rosa chinensis]XP_024166048.1 auxilin-related protein 1 isoform X2 [Rosa chinensis]
MDEFGVLTERFGLKPQGKSAPMAASRRATPTNNPQTTSYASSSRSSAYSNSNSNSAYASFLDDQTGFFSQSSSTQNTAGSGGFNDYVGIFSGGVTRPAQQQSQGSDFNLDSMFSGSSANTSSFDDGFGVFGNSGGSVNSNVKDDDFFGSFASAPNQSAAPSNDLLGDLGGVARKLQSTSNSNRNGNTTGTPANNAADSDDLLPGFGVSNASNSGFLFRTYTQESRTQQSTVNSTKSNFSSPMDDPFVVLESVSSSTPADSLDYLSELEQFSKMSNSGGANHGGSSNSSTKLKAPPKPAQVSKERSSGVSSIDDLEKFASAGVPNSAPRVPSRNKGVESSATRHGKSSGDDLDFMLSTGFRSSSVPKSRVKNADPIFDAQTVNRGGPRPQRTSSRTSGSMKKSPSASGIFDDLFSMEGASPMVAEFEEVEGESEERRKARLGRHQRTKERALQAVADMNQRDLRTQQEQEERRRIAEAMDAKIKGWAAGKEGNMRALLSSLQSVLWPDCGWEPVSLTDLITSGSVKKVYRKATLCVHPDKVQQKGASLQQKYTAEKVFDILKEAWTKFNKEELS